MDNLDEKMKDLLIKRAEGYEFEEKEVIAGKSGKPERVKIVKKHVPPDIKAIRHILHLRYMGRW